ACASENHALLTSALQDGTITLGERSPFDLSSRQGQPRDKVVGVRSYLLEAEPCGGPSKRRARQRWRSGAGRDPRPPGCSTLLALVPGVPPFGGVACQHSRRGPATVRAWSALFLESLVCVLSISSRCPQHGQPGHGPPQALAQVEHGRVQGQ